MAQDPSEFAIRVPIGGDDQLTPMVERAERRFRSFRNYMRREMRTIRREMAPATAYGPQPAGNTFGRIGLQRASARYQRLSGPSLNALQSPASARTFTNSMRQATGYMRQMAPLSARTFGAITQGTRALAMGVQRGYYRAFGSAGVGGGISRAFGPVNAVGRGIAGGARMVRGAAGAVGGVANVHNLLSGLAVGYVAKQAADTVLGGPLQLAGSIEQAQITFDTLLGGAEKAANMMEFLFSFAEKSPLRFEPVRQWGQQLLQWGFSAERIPGLMNAIASSAAAMQEPEIAGAGITRAFGQMRLRGRVLMEEINQLQDQGVPALDIIAKGYDISTQALIRWMETGARPATLEGKKLRGAIDILQEGLTERYGNMLERQSKTLLGMWATLQDIFTMRFVLPWGQGLAEGVQPHLRDLTTWLEQNKTSVNAIGQMFKEWGSTLAGAVTGKVREIVTGVAQLFGSPEWKNAKSFGEQWGVISSRVGELLWGNQQGQQGLVGQVMEWAKGQAAGLMEWGQNRWTDFSNMIGEKIQTWTTWTAERIGELKDEAFKRFAELIDYFKGQFQSTIVSAIKTIIPWWTPPGGQGPTGAPGGNAAGTAAAGRMTGGPMGVAASVAEYMLRRFPITSPFMQPNGISFGGGPHRGIDIGAPGGSAIYSPVAGTFGDPSALGLSKGYGRAVVVIDDKGNTHIFGHTAGGALGPLGGRVDVGQQIATVGAYANKVPGEISTGEHIHYEIRNMGDFNRQVNPSEFLTGLLSAPTTAPVAPAGSAAGEGSNVVVDVGTVNVTVSPHEDPAAVSQAVADEFASQLAGSLEGAFANMPRVTR